MDDIRDGQKTDSISRYMDSHSVRTNPFGENRTGERAYRRAERIAAAMHLLTNHVEPSEAVSRAVREGAVELLRVMLRLRDEMRSTQSNFFLSAQAKIRHLISLVRILTVSGYVSIQNATIMVESLDELGNFLQASQRTMLTESIAISRDDLLDARAPLVSKETARPSLKDVKDIQNIKDTSFVTDTISTSITTNDSIGQLSARSQNVIETLKNGGSMGIKEVCSNLPEYSEKMIQRELSELVSQGKVRKIGLKRWSKYSIAS